MKTGVRYSIVLCTYNRAHLLAGTLDSLRAQHPPPDDAVEVVVVDNNSTDATAALLATAAHGVRHVREPQQGLSHARNRGIAESTGELVIFIDDDVLLEPGWLQAYRDAARQYPEAPFFGGRIRPHWPEGRPGWVRDEGMALLAGVFGTYDRGMETRPYLAQDGGPMGANFAVRRPLFEALGGFDPGFGRRGDEPGRGEESDFFKRARAAGHEGVYVGQAGCLHHVAPHRLALGALYRHGIASAHAHRALTDPQARGSLAGALGYLLRGGAQLVKGRGDRFRQCVINAGIQMGLRR